MTDNSPETVEWLQNELEARTEIVRAQIDVITEQRAVIARLLDGWRDAKRKGGTEDVWYKPGRWEPMSDGEAAIIRAHHEKTQ
jgi:hypothetical protein